MKKVICLAILGWVIGSNAQAITVHEGDIANKTNLIGIAKTSVNGQEESILTDDAGISLYTFRSDSSNVSKCLGGCLTTWPPMHVPANATIAAPFGKIQGNDGVAQLTLNGLPLYHYDDDKKPGDAFGQYPKWDVIVVLN